MGITEHNQAFNKNPEDDEAFQAIFEALQVDVKKYIDRNFPVALKSTRQVTEFLNTTFLAYKKKVAGGHGPWAEFNTARLSAYLRGIARRKLADAKHHEEAAKRDSSRVEQAPTEELPSVKTESPVKSLIEREQANLLRAELLNEELERNRLINLMYFGMQLSARDIEEVLRNANGGNRVASDSTILRVVEKTKVRLAKLGQRMVDDNDE